MHNKVPFTKFNQDSTVRRTLENKVMVPMKRMLMMTILISMTKMNDEEHNRMITIVLMVKVLMMVMVMMQNGHKGFSSRLSRQTVGAHVSCT